MSSSKVRKRGAMLVLGILAVVVLYSIIYQQLLINIAGVDASIISSVQVVIESLTTAGFGGDTEIWQSSDIITGFVIIMNLTGVVVVFLAIPVVIIPLLQPALKPRPNKDSDLTNHLILCGFSGDEDVLIQELEDDDIPYLIVSEDSEDVIQLESEGYNCLLGDFDDTETFKSSNVDESRAVVINSMDKKSVSSIITVRECSEDVKIISVPSTQSESNYHEYSGSDVTVNPRSVLASSISNKIANSVTHNIDTELFRNGDFEFKELVVKEDSKISGSTIAESNLRENMGTSIIGIWKNGILIPSPPPDTIISSGSILLISGDYNRDYSGVEELSLVSKQRSQFSKVAIIGYGVVGSEIGSNLDSRGYDTLIVDKKVESADIIADVTEENIIEKLADQDLDAIILALDDDQNTIFTTVGLSSKLSDTFILARCNDVQNVGKLYSAGADYVLSLSRVTQRIIFSSIIGEDRMSVSTKYEVNIVDDHDFDDVSIGEENIRKRYGYTIIAVERDDEIIYNVGSEFNISKDDRLVVVEDN